jgi:hypothetical protein
VAAALGDRLEIIKSTGIRVRRNLSHGGGDNVAIAPKRLFHRSHRKRT